MQYFLMSNKKIITGSLENVNFVEINANSVHKERNKLFSGE